MKTSDIRDDRFLQAVNAIDSGDIAGLKELISFDPNLIRKRLETPEEEAYFKNPYLLWFIADNPIRNFKLAENIVETTQLLADAVKQYAPQTAQLQLDYALGLVATGRIPRESGKQIAMMDVLIDAGAQPGGGKGALAHGNVDAANHLINRGGNLTVAVAVGLRRTDDIVKLLPQSDDGEKITALTLAAFWGMDDMVSYLLGAGIDPNGYPPRGNGFHEHATPLHQGVYSGSLETVKLLVEAGADLDAPDKAYNGNPLGWAIHMQTEEGATQDMRAKYKIIEDYLKAYNPE